MTRPTVGPFRVDRDDRGKRVLSDGVTEWDLRSGRYRRLFKGVYVGRSVTLTPLLLAQAALLLVDPLSVVSHQSAARIWGGVVPDDGLAHVSWIKRRPQVHGLAAHRVSRGGQKCATVHGVRLTTPAQTFLDLAADLGLVDLVVLGDSLVRAKRVTPAQLVEAATAFRGRSRRMARRAAATAVSTPSPMTSGGPTWTAGSGWTAAGGG